MKNKQSGKIFFSIFCCRTPFEQNRFQKRTCTAVQKKANLCSQLFLHHFAKMADVIRKKPQLPQTTTTVANWLRLGWIQAFCHNAIILDTSSLYHFITYSEFRLLKFFTSQIHDNLTRIFQGLDYCTPKMMTLQGQLLSIFVLRKGIKIFFFFVVGVTKA